ncbi:MAG: trimethylamine methyltransferase family protein, partial [Deltaproteobacteria bacterium]|nr:trimethylamine methyltransferase family protein [Deltaproteobacteria bacterium]
MNLMGLQGGQYSPLSTEQVETVHQASLKILEKIGITYEEGIDETVQMLEDNGAGIDRDRSNITFPQEMIVELAAKAPEKVVLCGQESKNDLHLTEDRVHLGTGGAALKILDLESGNARPTTLKDLYDVSRLVDQLDNIHFLVKPCVTTDVALEDYNINWFYTCLSASSKHVMSGVNDEKGLLDVIEMASMIAGGLDQLQKRPSISIITCFAISPLKLCTQSTRIMQEANRNRIPVVLS